MFMKKIIEAYYHLKIDKLLKISNYLIYLIFILFIFYFVPKTFQNDTFYTIKIGSLIRNNGIDFLDHFCFIKNLSYTYPHFLYDILISFIYDKLGFLGIYLSTIIFTFIISVCLYKINSKLSNKYIGFIITIIEFLLLIPFFTARAQIVTFILFILTYYFIEKYLENFKIKYAIYLVIIPILIANIHVAVFPFYFVLYLPYFGEYIVSLIIKRKKDFDYEKLSINCNQNIKKLFLVFIITLITGFLTPLKFIPYTYLINTFRGNSLSMIQEHLPLILINNKGYLIFLSVILFILIFKKVKITLKDLFFFLGMTLLSLMQTRQISMAVIFNGFLLCKLLFQIYEIKSFNEYKVYKFKKCVYLPIVFMMTLVFIVLLPDQINKFKSDKYIDDELYPVKLVEYVKENIDYQNKRFYNDYNYGSYLLFNDIPVFVDSRADLYTKEFNDFSGNDILTDLNNFYYDFDNMLEKYKFDYFIVNKDKELDILIRKGYDYKLLYEDEYFVLWEVGN